MDINLLDRIRNMKDEDITNKFLGGFLSVEFLVAIVIAAVAWGSTTSKLSALENHVVTNQEIHQHDQTEDDAETKELRKDIGEIKEALSSIRVNQQYFSESIREQKEQTAEMLKLLQKR